MTCSSPDFICKSEFINNVIVVLPRYLDVNENKLLMGA